MSNSIETLSTALGARYVIDREIGRGGMARVYAAVDTRYGRKVALKVMRPDLAAAVGADRFLREIELTAGLNHPHILPLLDSGAADDRLYYVLPLVAGGSLRDRLESQGCLSIEDVLSIATPVASALDYANGRAIVHRDIKPENILFSEGHAVVSDFGVAGAVSSLDRRTLTRTGFLVGTLGYMSPEQAAGSSRLDARSDEFGLACTVYETLVGEPPSGWPADEDVRLGRLHDAPEEHRVVLDRLPGRVEQVLARALALRPKDRYAGAGEFVAALQAASTGTRSVNDAEAREILSQATELSMPTARSEPKLSLGGLERAAAEAGIPPEAVRSAALEAHEPRGGAVELRRRTLRVERYVPRRVPESAVPDMVDEIQRSLGIVGHVSRVGTGMTWSPAMPRGTDRKVVVTVTPTETGGTSIRIMEHFSLAGWRKTALGLGAGLGVMLMIMAALAIDAPHERLLPYTFLFATTGAFLAARGMTRIPARQRRPELVALADRLEAIAARSVDQSGSGT